ncbi:hypothetical protein QL285_011071 [Trifolium repens]|nr:hypothetical protein QL285_011071 [Trifolium repens]
MEEETIPNPAVGKGVDEDTENIKIAEDALKSLVDSISSDRAVPDASASLAQDQPQDTADDVVENLNVQQDTIVTNDVSGNPNTLPDDIVSDTPVTADNVMSENLENIADAEEEGANDNDSTEMM